MGHNGASAGPLKTVLRPGPVVFGAAQEMGTKVDAVPRPAVGAVEVEMQEGQGCVPAGVGEGLPARAEATKGEVAGCGTGWSATGAVTSAA